ncbi:MAG: DUF4011 domain-containing protein, partial [Opitutales bacterium]|nr:DUF4011 domain-containing protein [Opitutales bacterium]
MSENVTEQVLLCSESENVTSFAHQQAGIPLLHRLLIANKSTEPLVRPSLRIRTDPLFASPCVINLSDIGVGVETILYEDALNIRLSPEFLSAQRERTDGFVVLELYSGERLVAQDIVPLSVLAYNEWSGLAELPDLLGAFCTPNQPAVAGILSKASGILKKITKRGELDAYQSADPKRVMRIVESIFIATQKCGIAYCVPPASYEAEGQKIRFPEELVASRLGSCLDLALHFCACMEAAGLHPLLIVDKGHAYAGCWLKAGDSFDLSVESDLQQFRKLVAGTDPHIVVFETTMAAGGSETSFDEAETHARKHLEQSEEFRFALDIQRARANRILPLPVSVHEGRIVISYLSGQEREAKPMDDEVLEGRFGGDDASLQDKAESRDRLSIWANQLLDLSLRNRLLNFGKNKSIELRTHALHILEDRIASKDEFTLLPDAENDPRSAELHNKRNGERLDESRLKADLEARKLRVACTKEELEKRLLSLSRDARIGLEEGGANTLYLALGVLEWKDSVRTDRVNRAPILLVPVSLTRQSVRSGYKLRRLDEETRVNVTLLEKLKRDFEIEVKGVNPPPEDKAGVDVPLVLKRFREAVLQPKGFEVREEAHLGVFQFAKFLLWKDLMDRAELLKRNPVVAHLIDNSNQPYRTGDDVPFAPVAPSVLDDQLPAVKNYCIMDADSSQLSAVASAAAGLSFVMIGPPGTGKSQTISNIISFLIAMGKTVLFVAEKRAALEVVKGRLEKAGLGPFLLELHSNKTGKAEVIEQFRQAVNFGEGSTPEQWTMFGTELQRLRENLNSTVRALHFRLPNGMSAYRCNGVLVGTKGDYPRLTFKNIASHTPEQVSHMRGKLRDLSGHLEGISDFAAHPLIMVRYPEWTPYWEGQALEALAQLRNAAALLKSSAEELGKCLEMENPELSLSELNSYAALLEHSLEVPSVGEKFIQDTSSSNILEITRQGVLAIRSLAEARVALDGWKLDRLSGLKVAQMVTDWIDANMAFFLLRPLKRNRIKKLLAQYSIASHVPENDEVEALLQRIANFQSCQKILADTAQAIGPVFGPLWAKAQAEPSLLEKAQQWHKRFTSLLHTFAGTRLYLPSTFRGRLSAILSKEPEKIAPTGAIAQAAHAYSAALKTFGTKWQNVCAAFCFEKNQWEGLPMPSSALEIAERIEKHSGELRQWCRI